MTQAALGEYAAALRERYYAAGKKGKGSILDEFCRTTDRSGPGVNGKTCARARFRQTSCCTAARARRGST